MVLHRALRVPDTSVMKLMELFHRRRAARGNRAQVLAYLDYVSATA